MRYVMLLLALALGAAQAQDEVVFTGDELLSGEADHELRQLGKRAANARQTITVTAPEYWQELVAEQLRAGAGEQDITIAFRGSFMESVIVRLRRQAGAGATPVTEPEPELIETVENRAEVIARSAPRPRPSKPLEPPATEVPADPLEAAFPEPEVAATRVQRPAADAESPSNPVGGTDASGRMSSVVVAEPVLEQKRGGAASDSAAPGADPDGDGPAAKTPVAVAPRPITEVAAMPEAEARASLEERLNRGRPITKSLTPAQLRRGDRVFVTGDARAVVRRTRVATNAYWLEGELDLERDEVELLEPGKYEITERLRLAQETTALPSPAQDDPYADARSEMEARYNAGRPITDTIRPEQLKEGDVLYRGDGVTVVVRRKRVALQRFWLEGRVDYTSERFEPAGKGKYRVLRAR